MGLDCRRLIFNEINILVKIIDPLLQTKYILEVDKIGKVGIMFVRIFDVTNQEILIVGVISIP